MKRDYYEILGISKGASEDEIKRAYKRLAKEYHPDVAKDKKEAEEKFKEINEAYQVLSNTEKRKMYDQFGHTSAGASGGGGWDPFGGGQSGAWGPFSYSYSSGGAQNGFGGDFDPLDIFEQVFGFRGQGSRRRTPKGRSFQVNVEVSFLESLTGCEKQVPYNGKVIKIKIPQGVKDGSQIKYSGYGESAPQGGVPGDLYVSVVVTGFPRGMERDDSYNAFSKIEVSYPLAVLGGTLEITSVDPRSIDGTRKIKLKIPSGTQNGTTFRLREHGFPYSRGSGRGDHFIQVSVIIPAKVSRDEKRLLEELAKIS